MNERAEIKREKCYLRKEIRDAGLSFQQNKQVTDLIREGVMHLDSIRFALYPTYEEMTTKVERLIEIDARIEEIEDAVPELKA